MEQTLVTKTEIQSIEAITIIKEFESIKSLISDLSESKNRLQIDTLLTRKQVSEILGISLVTLHAWCKKGVITSYKIGNKVRFKQSDIMNSLRMVNTKESK